MNDLLNRAAIAMSVQRRSVPDDALKKFDIERKDRFKAISDAVKSGDTDSAAAIFDEWTRRVEILRLVPASRHMPPCLLRRDGETTADYINRIMELHCHA